jgi:hypothetical protein
MIGCGGTRCSRSPHTCKRDRAVFSVRRLVDVRNLLPKPSSRILRSAHRAAAMSPSEIASVILLRTKSFVAVSISFMNAGAPASARAPTWTGG